MSELDNHDDVGRAEEDVAAALEPETAAYLELGNSLMDVAFKGLDTLTGTHVTTLRAVHVCAIILTRLLNDARACLHLLRRGYVMQGLSLTAGMLEFTHAIGYIGRDEERAQLWRDHNDPARGYPSIRLAIKATAESMGAPQEHIDREYDEIYRQMCMAKHGNPIVLGQLGITVGDETIHLRVGPYVSTDVVRMARSTMGHLVRYIGLATLLFTIHHVSDPLASALKGLLREVHDDAQELIRMDQARFHVFDA